MSRHCGGQFGFHDLQGLVKRRFDQRLQGLQQALLVSLDSLPDLG